MAGDFEENLFGCFGDMCSFLVVLCVPFGCSIIQSYAVTKVTNESCIIPYCMPILLGCIGSAINRGDIREHLNISGNFCTDFMLSCCCLPCAVCQEYREVKYHSQSKAS